MEMCFHGNQLSWVIKLLFISLYSKYHSPGFICLSIILAPVISSLDGIYCSSGFLKLKICTCGKNKRKGLRLLNLPGYLGFLTFFENFKSFVGSFETMINSIQQRVHPISTAPWHLKIEYTKCP